MNLKTSRPKKMPYVGEFAVEIFLKSDSALKQKKRKLNSTTLIFIQCHRSVSLEA